MTEQKIAIPYSRDGYFLFSPFFMGAGLIHEQAFDLKALVLASDLSQIQP